MVAPELVTDAIYEAVRTVNEALGPDQQLAQDLRQPILGPRAQLDSLGLLNLLVAVESQAQSKLKVRLSLTLELTQPQSGVETIEDLRAYLLQKCSERQAA